MGCLQHPGHQDYELLKADLFIFIGIQTLEYFVNARLILVFWEKRKAGAVEFLLSSLASSELSPGQPGTVTQEPKLWENQYEKMEGRQKQLS